MAALTHSDSKSWGLDKFSPRNSKWLQSNISDTEGKVRAMITILEEDADSFRRRAEMYYKRRPELMSLVKEFYGAYRSLAERYDVAAGALRQAHLASDEPPSEPQTPDATPPGRSPFNDTAPPGRFSFNDSSPAGRSLFNDSSPAGRFSFNDTTPAGRFSFASDDSISPSVKKGLRFSEETERLKERVLGETERAVKAEREILTLKGNLLDLSFEKDEAWEKVSQLESEILTAQIELKRLKQIESEISTAQIELKDGESLSEEQKLELELLEKKVELQEMEIEGLNEKLGEIERQKVDLKRDNERLTELSLLSEINERKLQSKIGELEGKLERMKLEIIGLKRENLGLSEKLGAKNEEIELNRGVILNLESDREMILSGLNNLKLELAIKTDVLKSSEKMNYKQESDIEMLQSKIRSQEDYNHGLIKEIGCLNEAKIQSEEQILNLSKDLSDLKGLKERFEKEIDVHLREKETLQNDLTIQIQDTFDLANKLQVLTSQTENAIRANTVLRDAFTKYEIERGILSEKNEILEREIENLSVELEFLREKICELEISERSLKNEKRDFERNFGEIQEQNFGLESSLSDLKSEFGYLIKKLRKTEQDNSDLSAEKDNLFSQVEKFKEKIRNLEENNSDLSTERDLMQNDLMDLQELLSSKNQEHEARISMHVSEKSDLNSQIENLIKNNGEINLEFEKLREKLKESESEKSDLFSEKSNLSLQVESMKDVIKNLEQNEKDLEEKLSDLIKEKEFTQNRAKELERSLNSKTEEHEFHSISIQKEISNLNFEIENLRGKLKKFEADKSVLISEKSDLKSQVKHLEENKSDLIKEKDLTQNRVRELEEILSCRTEELELNSLVFQDQITEYNFEIEKLREKLKKSEHSCKSLLEQKWNLLSEKDDLFSEVERITNVLKNLEEKHSELEERHWELSHEKDLMQNQFIIHLNNLNQSINETTTKNNSEIQNLQEKLRGAEIEISGHISEKNSLKTKIEMLSCIIDEIKHRNDELNNSLSDLNSQIDKLRENLKESEEDKSDLISEKTNLLSKVEGMRIVINNFEEKHMELEGKHISLSKERDMNQNELKKLEKILTFKSEEHKSAIENQISTHKSERENLQKTINEISIKNSELENFVSNLNSKMKDLNEQKSLLIAEKDDLSSQLHGMITELKKLESKHEDLEENHVIMCKEKDLMHIQLNGYLSKNTELESFVSNLNSQIDGLNSKLNESEKYCESLHEEKNDLSSQLHSVKRIMNSLESKHEDLEENHSIITKERDLLQIELNELNNYLRVKTQEHLNKINEISGKNHELESLVSNLNSKRSLLIAQNDDLSTQVYNLETVLKNLESKHEDLEEDYSMISKERDLMKIQLNELNNYLQAMNKEYSNKINEISSKNESFVSDLNSKIDDLNLKRSLLIAQKDDLSSQVYGLETVMKNLESKHEDLEENYSIICKERDAMQIQLDDLNNYLHVKSQKYLNTIDQISAKNSELKSFVSNLSSQIDDLNSKRSLLIAQKDELSSQLYSVITLLKNLESKHEDLEENHAVISKERDLMQIQLNELSNFLRAKNEEYSSTVKSYDLHVANLQNEIISHVSKIETLENKNSQLENYLSNIRLEKDALFSKVEKLEDKHFELETKHRNGLKERELLQNQINNLHLNLETEEIKHSSVSNHLFILEKSLSDMVDQHLQASLLTEQVIFQLEKEERENQGLKSQNGEILDLNVCLNVEISVLNTVLRNLGLDLEELKVVKGNLEREIERSKNEFLDKIEGLNANLEILKDELVQNEEIRNELEMEKSDLIMELLISENLKLFFENLCDERGALLKDFNDEVKVLNSDKFELNKTVDSLEGENKILKEELKGNLVISQFDLNHVKTWNQELSQQMEGIQTEKAGLEKNIEKCDKYISNLINEIISLQIKCAVFEENLFELILKNEGLEINALAQRETLKEGIFAKESSIEGLNVKLAEKEGENAKLKAGLDAYLPLIELLRDCVASIELHTLSLSKRLNSSQLKQEKSICDSPTLSEIPSGAVELQNLISKIESLEESLINTTNQSNNLKTLNDQPESSSKSRYITNNNSSPITNMKDIELDKIYNNEIKEVEDPMLHLWEEKPRKSSSVNGENDLHLMQEIKNSSEQNTDMKKVLETLNLDSQRLSTLKSGIEELKQKLNGKLKLNDNNEYNEVKFQVYEMERILNKQVEINSKANKNAEYYYNNNFSGNLSEEQKLVRKSKIQEVTQKGFEKITRIELEFEKVKFVVQRLDDTWHEKKKGEEKRVRVLLRDYIYGRRKKLPLCGCIRSETN